MDSGLAAGAPVIAAGVDGLGSEFVFNAQELVVLSNPVTAAERAGLDLASAGGYCQVGNCYVFGFAAAVGACLCRAVSSLNLVRTKSELYFGRHLIKA